MCASRGINYRLVEHGFISDAGDVATFNAKLDEIARMYLTIFGVSKEDILTEADYQAIAEHVWNFAQNGTLMRDRVQGTDEAANEARRQLTRTDDCSGRGMELNDHDHIKWMAAKQAEMDEKLDAVLARLGE